MRCALMQILCRGSRDWTHCPCPAMQLLMQSSRQWIDMNKYDKQLGSHATIDRHQGRNRIPGEPQKHVLFLYIYIFTSPMVYQVWNHVSDFSILNASLKLVARSPLGVELRAWEVRPFNTKSAEISRNQQTSGNYAGLGSDVKWPT